MAGDLHTKTPIVPIETLNISFMPMPHADIDIDSDAVSYHHTYYTLKSSTIVLVVLRRMRFLEVSCYVLVTYYHSLLRSTFPAAR